jgi:hypothetical protein
MHKQFKEALERTRPLHAMRNTKATKKTQNERTIQENEDHSSSSGGHLSNGATLLMFALQ